MVESRQMEDMSDSYMYGEEPFHPYLPDTDILDRPDLFYSAPGESNWYYGNMLEVGEGRGFMQDKIIASHTCFSGHMDVKW